MHVRSTQTALLLAAAFLACTGSDPDASTPTNDAGTSSPPGRIGDVDSGGMPDSGPTAGGTISSVAAPKASLRRKDTVRIDVTVIRSSEVGEVTLDVAEPPAGLLASGVKIPAGIDKGTLTFTADDKIAFGTKRLRVTATAAGGVTGSGTVEVLVRGASGELDTSYGVNGVASYADLGIAKTVTAAVAQQGTVFVLTGKADEAPTITAVGADGKVDATRFGASAGKVTVPVPTGFTALAFGPSRLEATSDGNLVFGGAYKTSGTARGFSVFTLPANAATGAHAPASPPAVNPASISLYFEQATADGADYFELGRTTSSATPPNVPYVVRRLGTTGAEQWTSTAATQTFDVQPGETRSVGAEASDTFGWSSKHLYIANGVFPPSGGLKPRLYVRPRNGEGTPQTYLLEDAPLTTTVRTIGFSQPNGGDVYFSVQKDGDTACYYLIQGTAKPVSQSCHSATDMYGAFPLPGDRVAFAVGDGGKLVMRVRKASDNTPVAGWDDASGVDVGALPPAFTGITVIADDHEGILVVDLRSGGAIHRFWD